jgi:uncharacterized repeat protein (TIGR01451 family)
MQHCRNELYTDRGWVIGACLAALCCAAAPVRAEPPKIEVGLVAELRLAEGPAKSPHYRYVPAEHVKEGQVVYYTLNVRNLGVEPAADVVVVRPIPDNTQYVANTATGAGAEVSFSIDGGKTFARPERLRLPEQPVGARAPVQAYTHIRWHWTYPLEPGAVVLARFRAVFK